MAAHDLDKTGRFNYLYSMANPDRLRLAVFDLDGTLIDSTRSIVASIMACWEACAFPMPDEEAARRCIGLPWEESIRMLLPGAGEREIGMVNAWHEDVHAGRLPRPPRDEAAFEGAIEVLDALEAHGYLLGIVTSRGNKRVPELLEECGMAGRFATVKTVDHGPGKPNPYLLLEAMGETGVDKAETVMIGDTTYDVLMARNAGTSAIGVSWGVHEVDELHAAGAHHVVEAFDELPPLVRRVTGHF